MGWPQSNLSKFQEIVGKINFNMKNEKLLFREKIDLVYLSFYSIKDWSIWLF